MDPASSALHISFSTLACPDWSWGEIVTNADVYGYDGVEIRMIEGQTDLLARSEFAESHLALNLNMLELLARRMGARFVRVFGDVLPAAGEPAARHEVLRNIAGGLDAMAEYSDLHGGTVEVLIETHGDFTDSRLMLELLVHVRSPRVGVLWDTHHPWRFHGEPVAETYQRLKPWIRHTHWKDSTLRQEPREVSAEAAEAEARARSTNRGHRTANYVLFGTGEFPAAETLKLLVDDGYDGWFSLEWEKAWHPDLPDPEVVLPQFPGALAGLRSP
jgi:sugar phosphate isomerase/epimerase